MSKMPAAPKIFDPVKLEALTEPLFVRVEKRRGNVRSMIPLPAGEDGAAQGANWSKDDVRGIEQWLVNEWSGGGFYAITVSDSAQPTPQAMTWEIYYATSEYPEKTPPTLAAAISDRPVQTPQPQQVRPMSGPYPSAFPNGFPAGLPGQSFASPQSIPTGFSTPRQPQFDFFASSHQDAERRRYEEQIRELQAQAARAREEQLAAQHRQELERVRAEQQERMRAEQAAQNERFSKLEQMIATMASTKVVGPDPAVAALQEQNRQLMADREADKREREAERRERELRDTMQRQAEDTRRMIEAMQAQIVASQQNKGADPIIMFMQENARQQVEAAREQARQSTAQFAQLMPFMMNPRDIMAMAKESSNGLDQATRSITSTYQDILQMQRAAVEQILQLQGTGGSETIALVKEGLERASSFAERFIGGKTKEATVAQQSQAQIAQAQAAAMQAQAQALSAQAAINAQNERARAQASGSGAVQPSVAPAAGVNGTKPTNANAPAAVAAVAGPAGETRVSQTSSVKPSDINKPDAWTTGPVPPIAAEVKVRRHLGRTDEEWFGPILPQVNELRDGVARFIESISIKPPRLLKDNHVDGIEPEQSATVILQAAAHVVQNQIPIAAMIDLLGQSRVADFMDVLLPDVPQGYRDEVAQLVVSELKRLNGEEEEDDDDDDDDDDEEVEETKADPPQLAVVKPTQARA